MSATILDDHIPFAQIFEKFTNSSVTNLVSELTRFKIALRVQPSVWDEIKNYLCRELSDLCVFTLWHEFSLLRTNDIYKRLNDQFTHASMLSALPEFPQHYYLDFVRKNCFERCEGLWEKYPVFTAKVQERVEQLNKNLLACLINTNDCLEELAVFFRSSNNLTLSGLSVLSSDPHRGGRRILLLEFQDHTYDMHHKIVYKQRSLAAESLFHSAIKYLNTRIDSKHQLRSLKCIDKGEFGWMEYVSHGHCRNSRETHEFYFKSGILLSLLYLLGVNDCHFENIICDGQSPCLVDCETSFEPIQGQSGINATSSNSSTRKEYPPFSVISTGFLRCLSNPNGTPNSSEDLSAIAINPEFSTNENINWVYLNTDLMAINPEPEPPSTKNCLPTEKGFYLNPQIYTQNIVDGFSYSYRIINKNRFYFLSIQSLSACLQHRILFRPTFVYSALLNNLLQPGVLDDPSATQKVLSGLDIALDRYPNNKPIIESEQEQLLSLDIPYFSLPSNFHCVHPSTLDASLIQLFCVSGHQSFIDRANGLSVQDCNLQISLIQAVLGGSRWIINSSEASLDPSGNTNPLNLVTTCMETIWSLGSRDIYERISWVSFPLNADPERSYPGFLGSSLYDGSIGILLAINRYVSWISDQSENPLFHLWDKRRNALLFSLIGTISSLMKKGEHNTDQLGISGLAGIFYALKVLESSLITDNSLLVQVSLLTKQTQDLLEDSLLSTPCSSIDGDFLNGLSGAISIASLFPDLFSLDVFSNSLQVLLKYLDSSLIYVEEILNNSASIDAQLDAINVTHGLGGTLLALGKLHALTDKELQSAPLLETIRKAALLFSKSCEQVLNLFLELDPESALPLQWCNGISGVILASTSLSILIPEYYKNPLSTQTAIDRISCTLDKQISRLPAHVCCGFSGVLLCLSHYYDHGFTVDMDRVKTFALKVLKKSAMNEVSLLNSGISASFQPGLYSGLSGIAIMAIEILSSRQVSRSLLC